MNKKLICSIELKDEYLDLNYYEVKIKFWDGETQVKKNLPSLGQGDVLSYFINEISKLNDIFSIELKIVGDRFMKDHLMNISAQKDLKESRLRSAVSLMTNIKDANALKAFFVEQDCLVK